MKIRHQKLASQNMELKARRQEVNYLELSQFYLTLHLLLSINPSFLFEYKLIS